MKLLKHPTWSFENPLANISSKVKDRLMSCHAGISKKKIKIGLVQEVSAEEVEISFFLFFI